MARNTVWIIDDHELFAEGLKRLREDMDASLCVQCFSAPGQIPKQRENDGSLALILCDFFMPEVDTCELLKKLCARFAGVPLAVISSSMHPGDQELCLRAEASTFLKKRASPADTLKHLKALIQQRPVNKLKREKTCAELMGLSRRQLEVLIFVARGNSNKRIAQHMNISPETVKSHLSDIYRKIDCDNRGAAAEWARSHGFS